MIKEENIKPIPKYIIELIKKKDKHNIDNYCGISRFYSYLSKMKNELVQITVACKNRGKKWFCKQVAIHGVNSDRCLVKDMEFFTISGYAVGWYEQGLQKYAKWYETSYWCDAEDKYYNPYAPVVNVDYALKIDKYKYSAVNLLRDYKVIKYLKLYEKYPQTELLVKFGLERYADSITILKKVEKDKKFRKWLVNNKDELAFNSYYVSTIMLAYKKNKLFKVVQEFETNKKSFYASTRHNTIIKKYISKKECIKFLEYIQNQKTNFYSYADYLRACEFLGIDMSLDKNKFPHNFKKWHDIRIDQFNTEKALQEEKKKQEHYAKFSLVADKYLPLQRNLKDSFVAIIAKSPNDLVNEGKKLKHCVGSMNYDQKFIREESLIFFIRYREEPETPFVTVEYSLKNHKVLQCYGYEDSKPEEDVLKFVNKVWLPYANRKIKLLQGECYNG